MQKTNLQAQPLLLASIVLLGLVILRFDHGFVAGHMDEYDYLFVGRLLLDGQNWPTHTYIFGWDLNWYLYGLADKFLNGLAGARLLASIFGLLSLLGFYWFTLELWRDHHTALIATLLLALDAAHRFTSQLATYDIISFTLLVWSLPLLLLMCRQPSKNTPPMLILVSATLLVAAALSKYTVALYLPVIGMLILVVSPRLALAGGGIVMIAMLTYGHIHADQLRILYDIQIQGAHEVNSSYSHVLLRIGRQIGPTIAVALLVYLTVIRFRPGDQPKILSLIVLSLLFPAYHLISQNVISLQKHLLYSNMFLLPIIAYAISALFVIHEPLKTSENDAGTKQFQRTKAYSLTALVLLMIGMYGVSNQSNFITMQNSYPDVGDVIAFSEEMNDTSRVLSEDPYLFRYLLYSRVPQSQIRESTWLDNDHDGIFEQRDVKQAIWDEKFDYVFLTDQQHATLNIDLRTMMKLKQYKLLYNQRYSTRTMSGHSTTGMLSLYRRNHSVADNSLTN